MNLIPWLWHTIRRERAIRKLQDFLSERTGRHISRDEALRAHDLWVHKNRPEWRNR